MKLFYRVFLRLSAGIILILTGWAAWFYVAMIDEINDEVDDSLEDYSEVIITRSLAGEELPSKNNGSNNQYFLTPISKEQALQQAHISYRDSMIYISEKRETEPARILSTIFQDDNGNYYQLTVSVPHIEKMDLIEAILHQIIFLYIALLLTIILINILVFRKSMQPLYRLLHWIDNYRLGKKNAPLHNPTNITEFQKLNEAAMRNAVRSEEMYEEQKQFIGNASHELQTPLAICQNRIEMLLEDTSLTETQMEELVKTYHTLEHIGKLNKALLLLTKIENRQFTEQKPVELNSIIHQYIEDYKEVYTYKHISLEIREEGTFVIEMNELLATVLITNLLKNAYVHNVENGHIRIEITDRQILVCNSGVPTALDGEHIFERFYQGTKKEGSTGLGLAIALSVCQQNELSLSYFFREGKHCFRIGKTAFLTYNKK